jgi:replicative DNA helicase
MVDVSENSKPWVVDEKALLRAVLRQSDLMDMALFITPDDFAAESHGVVWAVFQELRQRNGAITPLTVSQMIRRHMQDRPQDAERLATYVMRLQADSTEFTADEVRDLAENVGNYAAMRRSKDELRGLLALAEGNDQRFFAEWKRVGDDLSNRKRAERVETWSQLIDETLDELWQQHEGAGTPALPTGLPTLDFQEVVRKGEMVVVGGRPSTGKTALGIWMATWAAKAGHTALMISLEMTGRRVVKRALSSYSGIPAGKLRRADFTVAEWDHIKDCAERQREWPLHTLYRGRIDYPTIVSEVRRLKAGGNLALLVVDYFQIIPKNVKRGMDATQTLAEMSGDFKRLAVQEDICVVLLSQLNRNHPGSDGGRARVEDLANTDALGRDADVVLLLNPDLQGAEYDVWKEQKTRGVILDVAKVRDGVVADVALTYLSDTVHFQEPSQLQRVTEGEWDETVGVHRERPEELRDPQGGDAPVGDERLHGAQAERPAADVRAVQVPFFDADA